MASLLLWASARLKRLAFGEHLLRRHPVHYPIARRTFELFERAGVEERRRLLRGRLDAVLRAAKRTRHGRRIRDPHDLENWPFMDKCAVRADPRAFWARPAWLAAHTHTSGTTGLPLELIRSSASVAYEQACIDGLVARLGTDPRRMRIAVLRGEVIEAPASRCWSVSMGGRRLTLSSYHLSRATIDTYANALCNFRPDLLCAYPSALESLCRLLTERGRCVKVPRVVCSSEVLPATTWERAREVLGCALADHYGQAERVAFAYATSPGEYRFLPGYGFIELIRIDGDATHATYEIAGTALWNLAMPLVRYQTGDLVRLPASLGARELEEIALGLRPFPGIVGRDADVLLLPEGARLTAINHLPRDVTRIVGLQIVQESLDHVCIRIVPGPRYDAAAGEAFLARARAVLPVSMRVSIEPTDSLERSRLGKIPVIVHRPAVRQALMAARLARAQSE